MADKITKFTKPVLQQARHAGFIRAAEEAVAKIAAEHGLTFSFGNATFSDISVTLKAEFRVGDSASVEADEREQFRRGCVLMPWLKLIPSDYGAPLGQYNGEPVFLVGFNHKKPKYALKSRTGSGKTVNYTEAAAYMVVSKRSAQAA